MTKQHPFRFGVINERMGSPEGFITKARHTEELGYATFLLRDHFIQEPFGDQFAPISPFAAWLKKGTRNACSASSVT
jgi:hypothetical protein